MSAAREGNKLLPILVLAFVPLVLAGLVFGVKRLVSKAPGSEGSPAAEWVPLDEWSRGKPRTLVREWTEQGVALEELCFFAEAGEKLGCGIARDGTPWEGTFVEWHLPRPEAKPPMSATLKAMGQYRGGKRDGVWKSYRPDGSLSAESVFDEGRFVSRTLAGGDGNRIVEMGKALPNLPVSRRPVH